jgi:hypothetical protein
VHNDVYWEHPTVTTLDARIDAGDEVLDEWIELIDDTSKSFAEPHLY